LTLFPSLRQCDALEFVTRDALGFKTLFFLLCFPDCDVAEVHVFPSFVSRYTPRPFFNGHDEITLLLEDPGVQHSRLTDSDHRNHGSGGVSSGGMGGGVGGGVGGGTMGGATGGAMGRLAFTSLDLVVTPTNDAPIVLVRGQAAVGGATSPEAALVAVGTVDLSAAIFEVVDLWSSVRRSGISLSFVL
jgi:hypothetical protein